MRRTVVPDELATELARVRQRGLAYIDRTTSRQHRIETPLLDALASVDGFDPMIERPAQLTDFIDKRLIDYGVQHSSEALFIRQLYFDDHGRAPGPGRPSALLDKARRRHGLSDEPFRRLQRQHLLDFSSFLLMTDQPRWRRGLTLLALVATIPKRSCVPCSA